MDGTSLVKIIERPGISAFAIDRKEKLIYWAGATSIESADYEGYHNRVVMKISNIVTSLAVLENKLFWLYPHYGFEDSVLWTCTLVNGFCDVTVRKVFKDNAVKIRAYNFNEVEVPNPCKHETDDCEQLCIRTSDSTRRCVCTVGWQLKDDFKSCRPIHDFLLYSQGDVIKGRILDITTDIFIESILPIKLRYQSILSKKTIDFDYDARRPDLIFSDDLNIYVTDLKTGDEQTSIIYSLKYNMYPTLDWISKNVYCGKVHKYYNNSYITIHRSDVFSEFDDEKTIIKIKKQYIFKSMVVHPNRGYLFFTVFDATSDKTIIFRTHSDGSGLELFRKNLTTNVSEGGLGIDYVNDRLYWFSKDTTKIYHATLRGSDLKTIDVSIIQFPRTISIYRDWMYISNFTSIWRLHKKTGENPIQLVPKSGNSPQLIYGAKVFSPNVQSIDEDHPCAIDNGGCARYCFPMQEHPDKYTLKGKLYRVCGCNDHEKVQEDGRSCA